MYVYNYRVIYVQYNKRKKAGFESKKLYRLTFYYLHVINYLLFGVMKIQTLSIYFVLSVIVCFMFSYTFYLSFFFILLYLFQLFFGTFNDLYIFTKYTKRIIMVIEYLRFLPPIYLDNNNNYIINNYYLIFSIITFF